VHRHIRPRCHQPRERPSGRDDGQRAGGGHHRAGTAADDRHRRLPGNPHRGSFQIHHQTQLPHPRRRRHSSGRE